MAPFYFYQESRPPTLRNYLQATNSWLNVPEDKCAKVEKIVDEYFSIVFL
jgi:hypothetical protein